MKPETQHLVEKIQVRLAAVIAAAVSWWAIWRLVGPADQEAAWVFFADGSLPRLAVLAGLVWALAAVCAVLTVSSRPEGAVLATLVGVAAMSVRSGPARNLLVTGAGPNPERSINAIFALLTGEILVLAAVLAGAVAVIYVVRALVRPLAGQWFWSTPAAADAPGKGAGKGGKGDSEQASPRRSALVGAAGFLAVELAVAVILLQVTFRSTDTGQIAFALAGSFFAASFAAHMAFPIRGSIPCWLGPVIVGALVLGLGALGHFAGPGPLWRRAILVASSVPLRAGLPAQWIGLGCGGAIAGFWASCRFREAPEEQPKPSY